MRGAGALPVLGHPLDRLFAAYMAVAGLALLFPHRPGGWPLLLALHAAVVLLAWPVAPIGRAADAAGPRARRLIRGFADWLPLLLVPLLYTELATLNSAVHGGRYFDEIIIGWEQAVFGGQPSRDWAAVLPSLPLSEAFHAAYLSYYFIIFIPPLLVFLRRGREEFRFAVFAIMLSFFAHYLFFIFFPVQGPRYLFAPPTGGIETGFFYQSAHAVLEAGSSQGAAFPSSHVGVSVTQTLVTLRLLPALAPAVGILTLGLALGAVYGGFHYAIDALAGLLLGVVIFRVAGPLFRRLSPTGAPPAY